MIQQISDSPVGYSHFLRLCVCVCVHLTSNSKVYHISILIVNCPVRIPDGVGKFNQVSKFGRGHNVVELHQ